MTISECLKNPQSTLLIFALLLSWLGMKAIAGFSWILFIVAAWRHFLEINSAMGMLGAIFILTLALSLFLQIKNYAVISDFMYDFRSMLTPHSNRVRKYVNNTVEIVQSSLDFPGIAQKSPDTTAHGENVKIDLDALDVNKDGIFDDKDIMLLHKTKKDKE